jgi:hypothetical protein
MTLVAGVDPSARRLARRDGRLVVTPETNEDVAAVGELVQPHRSKRMPLCQGTRGESRGRDPAPESRPSRVVTA